MKSIKRSKYLVVVLILRLPRYLSMRSHKTKSVTMPILKKNKYSSEAVYTMRAT